MGTTLRNSWGQYVKGVSGNPTGRKPGVRNAMSRRVFDKLATEGDAILQTLIDSAKAGDTAAARYLVSLFVPRARFAGTDGADLEETDLSTAHGIAAAHAGVVNAVAQGRMDADTAAALSTLLAEQRRAVEVVHLEQKITALENKKVIDMTALVEVAETPNDDHREV